MIKNRPIVIVGGARPNFMKIAPLQRAFKSAKINAITINTNQHFDDKMSKNFLKYFGIKIDHTLSPERGSIVELITSIMDGLEKIFNKINPIMVVVVGDVNSTLCAALVANKMNIKLCHVEAGLRSKNKAMPEEHNRVIVDHISDLLFVPNKDAVSNLKKEGVVDGVHIVGNIMIDTVKEISKSIPRSSEKFYFCTLHRAENVDSEEVLGEIVGALAEIARSRKLYFSLHPRTEKMLIKYKLFEIVNRFAVILPPLSYAKSLYYIANAELVLTDSGGIQEETSYLGVPCLTLRTETERPITVLLGTNTVCGIKKKGILAAYRKKQLKKMKNKIPMWDGKSAQRIVRVISKYLDK